MDKSSARGMARQLFRKVISLSAPSTSPYHPIFQALVSEYKMGKGVEAREIVGKALAFRDRVAASGPFPTSCEIVRHPVRKRAVIEMVWPGIIEGAEQQWLICAGTVADMTKDELAVVEVNPPVAVSLHAVARLFERGSFDEAGLLPLLEAITLWVAPLLRILLVRRSESGADVVVPFADGLLLGTLEACALASGQGPTLTTVSRRGSSCEFLDPAFGRTGVGIWQICLHTYVHRDELFAGQDRILCRLEVFGSKFSAEMKAVRASILRGMPDPRAAARFPAEIEALREVDLQTLSGALHEFFSSADWRRHAEAHRRPTRFLN